MDRVQELPPADMTETVWSEWVGEKIEMANGICMSQQKNTKVHQFVQAIWF